MNSRQSLGSGMEIVSFAQLEEDFYALLGARSSTLFPVRSLGFGKAVKDAYHFFHVSILRR